MLRGDSNTLGRTEEVVAVVLAEPDRVAELFELYYQDDEWVRLRTSSALKRVWRADPSMIEPFIDRWVDDVAALTQPSAQWTFAQLLEECPEVFNPTLAKKAELHVRHYLESSNDWIVLNASMQALAKRAQTDADLRCFVVPHLRAQSRSSRKSVAGRANKMLSLLDAT